MDEETSNQNTGMIDGITKALQLAPRYLAVVALASGVYLFSPGEWLAKLGLDDLDKQYRPYVGGAFLISGGVVVVEMARRAALFAWACINVLGMKRKAIERLHALTEDEKQILRYYIAQDTRASSLRIDDGVVQGLVAARLIYRSSRVGDISGAFSHNIQDFAWEYLQKHPDLLVGSTNTCRTDRSGIFHRQI
jgi:hypothetical protein